MGGHTTYRISRLLMLYCIMCALCELRGCKNRPAPFPGWMLYKATKTGYVFSVLLLNRAHFLILFFFCWYVFCLSVVLVKLSVLTKWLARKYYLRKSNHGKRIISTKPMLRVFMIFWFIVLFHCFLMYLCCPQHYVMYLILLWHDRAYLCWKCR